MTTCLSKAANWLLRIGAIVLRNTRRVRLPLSSAHPDRELFRLVAARLKSVHAP